MDLVANLRRRADILRTMRAFFDARGFTEVETAVRVAAPAPEPHIDCPVVTGRSPDVVTEAERTFLRASPELQMKKLLACGMDRIYQIGPCFREGEIGRRHNPEFTMIEWYRRNATYLDILEDTKALLLALSPNPQLPTPNSQPPTPNPQLPTPNSQPPTTLTVREAYRTFAGWDPWTDWDAERFDFDMAAKIEPSLPKTPVFLMDYPPQAASLARLRGDVAERWELYVNGIELANCFTELCDGAEQRRRFEAARAARRALGESDYPLDDEFLALLPSVGSAAGVALGVDRLVMLLCGEETIASVRAPL